MRRRWGIDAMDGYLLDFTHLDTFQKWALVCAALLTIFYAVMRPWRRRKDPLAKPGAFSLAAQRQTEKQMTELLVELEQMARQMTAQIETRSAKLELLIKQADERLAALQAAGTAGANPQLPAIEAASNFPGLPDSRHAEVYVLADQGVSAGQIARQLARPNGEIELILALRGHEKVGIS